MSSGRTGDPSNWVCSGYDNFLGCFDGYYFSNATISITITYHNISSSTYNITRQTRTRWQYDSDYGTWTNFAPETVDISTNVIFASRSRTGYTVRWNTTSTGTGTTYIPGSSYSINSSLTVYLIETPLTFKASWNTNGGSPATITDTTATYNSLLALPTAPTKTGYIFTGWKEGTTTYTNAFTWTYTANTTFTAQWTAQYTATWNYNGGTGSPLSSTATAGESLIIPATPTKTGYDFSGWSDGTTTHTINITYNYGSAKTFTAQWTAKSYTITWAYDGGTQGSAPTTSINYDATLTFPTTAPTKAGNTFTGWKTGSDIYATSTATYVWKYLANTTFTAQWSAAYTVTFAPDGGSTTPASNTATIGLSYILPAAISRTGYDFDGWKTGTDPKRAAGYTFTSWSYTANTTFTALWIAKSYTITWAYDGGTQGSTPTTSINYDATLTFPTTAPTKAGNTFTGWKTGSDIYATSTTTYVWKYDANTTFTAQWSAAYTVTFAPDGGSTTPASNTATIGLSYTLPAAISRTGYDFDGWKTGTDPKRAAGYTFTSWSYTANTTFTALWIAKSYTITWAYDGGTQGSAPTTSINYDATLTFPTTAPTKAGNTFTGWKTGSDIYATSTATYVWKYLANTTFTAQWSAAYTVTFAPDGGSTTPASNTATIGLSYTLPAAISKTGYDFDGWKTGTDPKRAAGYTFTSWSYTANTTFTALWIAKSYTITWAYDGGTQGSTPTTSINYDATLTFPTTAPTKAGNTFTGWKTGSDIYATSTTTYVWKYDANTTFTAQWSAAYTVTFAPDGGSTTPASNTATIGLSYTLPAAISKTGYNFNGWKTGSDTYTAGATIASWSYTANTTFTAQWTPKSYIITWLYDGGTIGTTPTASINYDVTLTFPTAPTKAGYKFTGWKTGSDIYATSTLTYVWKYDANTTFTAQWSLQAFVATWNYAGGTPNTTITTAINLGETLQLPNPAPSKIGYIFAGWKTGSDTYTASFTWTYEVDKTFTAQWTARTYTIAYNDNLTAITGLTPTTVSYDQIIQFPTPSKTGYTFVAWYTDAQFSLPSYSGEYKWDFTTTKTFYAKYTINIYNISYYDNTTLLPSLSPSSANYGVSYTLPKPSKPGYRFDAWYLNTGFTSDQYKETITWNFLTDIKFYAKYSVLYSITYKDGTNTLTLEPTFGVTGEQYTLPSGPSKTGYTFNAWYIYDNFSGQSYTGLNTWNFPSGQTFYAKYIGITYNISYYDNATLLSLLPTSVVYNTRFTLPTPAAKPNYTFGGWSKYSNGSTPTYNGEILYDDATNINFYAKYILNAVTLIWDRNNIGGNTRTDNNVVVNSSVTAPTPKAVGYTFAGWYNSSTGGTLQVNANSLYTMPSSATTLYARWTDNGNIKFSDLKSTYNLTDPIKISTIFGLVGFSTTAPKKLIENFKGKGPNY